MLDLNTELLKVREQIIDETKRVLDKFDMEVFYCGTAGCIAGFIAANNPTVLPIDNTSILEIVEYFGRPYTPGEPLYDLFYAGTFDLGDVGPEHAVQAIDNFVTTGHPNWEEVLG